MVKGLCVRQQWKTVSYAIKYRNKYGKQRFMTIGKTDKITLEQARSLARSFFLELSEGRDPMQEKQDYKKALTIADLCDWYMKEGVSHKKESTLKIDRGRIETHIKPLIGNMPVKSVVRGDVEKMMYDIQEGKKIYQKEKSGKLRGVRCVKGGTTAASRTVQLLGAIFEFAKARSIISENPAHSIKKPKAKEKDVYLTLEEISRLGSVLKEARWQTVHKEAVRIISLILLTGCRKSEIESLRWEYVDFTNQCFRFPDTKTGKQNRAFGRSAHNFLKSFQNGKKTGFVFPARIGQGHFVGTPKVFRKVCATTDKEGQRIIKEGVTIHSLRHTFSTICSELGYNEFTIAALLGHHLSSITSRYTHAIDKSLIQAADMVSLRIHNALEGIKEDENQVIDIAKLSA